MNYIRSLEDFRKLNIRFVMYVPPYGPQHRITLLPMEEYKTKLIVENLLKTVKNIQIRLIYVQKNG